MKRTAVILLFFTVIIGCTLGDEDQSLSQPETVKTTKPADPAQQPQHEKIEGYLGASAPLTHYIQIIDNHPASFLATTNSIMEYDVDGDHYNEMIATPGGTIPETSIIKVTNENQFEAVNLNEMMNGSVVYQQSSNEFEVYYGLDKRAEQYKLTTVGLEFVGYING